MRYLIYSLLLTSAPVVAQLPTLLVASRYSDEVIGYDQNGQSLGAFAAGGGLDNPVGVTFGPDGDLYVASANTNQILRFDGVTGASLGVVASVASPRNLNFGPDGLLYVCSTGRVLRFTASGQALGVFVQDPAISGNTSLTFGPDYNLYVSSVPNNQVVRFDGLTGALLGVFADTGMSGTHDLAFGPDGRLYVTNAFSNNVVRFDGQTGAFLGVFVSDPALVFPLGMAWDRNGDLYVANQGADDVRRYDGATGSLLGSFVTAGSGGLDGPLFLTFAHDPFGPEMVPPLPGPAGVASHVGVTGCAPGGAVVIGIGTIPGAIPLPCAGVVYNIGNPLVLTIGAADEGGRLVHGFLPPGLLAGQQVLLQAVDFSACAVTPLLTHTF